MNKVTVILVLNSIYNVYVNDIIFGSYNSSAIALIECNKLTGLSYTDIQEYLVTDSVGNEYTQKEIFDLQRGVQNNFIIISGTLTQSGINPPVFTQNSYNPTLTINMSYTGIGEYLMEIVGGSVLPDATEIYTTNISGICYGYTNGSNDIVIETRNSSFVLANTLLFNSGILIRIPQ